MVFILHAIFTLLIQYSKLSPAIKEDTAFARDALPAFNMNVDAIARAVSMVQLDVSAVRDVHTLEQHKVALNWLSTLDFTAQQHDIIKRREEGTGIWFVESPQFVNWLRDVDKTLFCCGMPGAGKTMVAALAIDHISSTMPFADIGLAYVFCNYKAQADQSALNLLSDILKQLAGGNADISSQIANMCELHTERNTRPRLEDITRALNTAVASYQSTYIVVDALDECTDDLANENNVRQCFIGELRALQTNHDLRLLCTSRSIPDIVQSFASDPVLEIRASREDVEQFVAAHVSSRYNVALKSQLVDTIATAADGM